jgi:hypothetical protein
MHLLRRLHRLRLSAVSAAFAVAVAGVCRVQLQKTDEELEKRYAKRERQQNH